MSDGAVERSTPLALALDAEPVDQLRELLVHAAALSGTVRLPV